MLDCLSAVLLDAIRASPDDDLPRLGLGDWCLDQHDPVVQARGEFIHLQCRLERLGDYEPERPALQRRIEELRDQHQQSWLGSLRGLAAGYSFERGLVVLGLSESSLGKCPL